MSCSAITRSRSETLRTWATGTGDSSSNVRVPPVRLSTSTGQISASLARGLYHWRIWYMFTGPSAKYTAILKWCAGSSTPALRRSRNTRETLRDETASLTSLSTILTSLLIPTLPAYRADGGNKSDHRGAPGQGHAPERAGGQGSVLPRVGRPSFMPALEPGGQGRPVACPPQHLDGRPGTHVDRDEHSRQVAACQPDPIPGVEPVIRAVPGWMHHRMVRLEVAGVPNPESLVPDSPGQL